MVELVEMVQNISFESLLVSHFCNASGGRTTSDARAVKYTSLSYFPTVSISWDVQLIITKYIISAFS